MWAWLVLLSRLPGMSTDLSADASLSVRVTRYPSRNSLLVTNTVKRGQALLTLRAVVFGEAFRTLFALVPRRQLVPLPAPVPSLVCFITSVFFIGVLFSELGVCVCLVVVRGAFGVAWLSVAWTTRFCPLECTPPHSPPSAPFSRSRARPNF